MSNPNSMLEWWPKVKDLTGVPMPRTVFVPIPVDAPIYSVLDGKVEEPWWKDITAAVDEVKVAEFNDQPVFIRSDLMSNKHMAKIVARKGSDIPGVLWGIIEVHGMAFMMADPEAFVVREWLNLSQSDGRDFAAFGDLFEDSPVGLRIGRERRYFVKDGEVVCRHPYWPTAAIRHPQSTEWEKNLRAMNEFSSGELRLTTMAESISGQLGGYWSVDFARTLNDVWYFIDAAQGKESYHWEECHKIDGSES